MSLQLLFTIFTIYIVNVSSRTINNIDSNTITITTTTPPTTNLRVTNYSSTYNQLLNDISTYCMTESEYEEIYGFRENFDSIKGSVWWLMDSASKYIGLLELHHYVDEDVFVRMFDLWLKKEVISFDFSVDQVQTAVRFIDKKIPEIRRFYNLNYYEKRFEKKDFLSLPEDEVSRIFGKVHMQIREALNHSQRESLDAIVGLQESECFGK